MRHLCKKILRHGVEHVQLVHHNQLNQVVIRPSRSSVPFSVFDCKIKILIQTCCIYFNIEPVNNINNISTINTINDYNDEREVDKDSYTVYELDLASE